jgi:hypothetical protein
MKISISAPVSTSDLLWFTSRLLVAGLFAGAFWWVLNFAAIPQQWKSPLLFAPLFKIPFSVLAVFALVFLFELWRRPKTKIHFSDWYKAVSKGWD